MNRPNPFKEYLMLEPLPPDPPDLEVAAVDALASPAEPGSPIRARFPAATSTIQQPQPR